jgi:repressor LexA
MLEGSYPEMAREASLRRDSKMKPSDKRTRNSRENPRMRSHRQESGPQSLRREPEARLPRGKQETCLTPKAQEILSFIAHTQATRGAPPTLREIGRRFGIRSTNGVRYYIDLLERAGAIRRRPGEARGVIPEEPSAPGIPILGQIAAGSPVLSEENVEGMLDLERLGRSSPDFALRVRGDSMKEAGILDGDMVLVRRDPAPRNGEIVVAMIGDEATVKRFHRKGKQVVLQPENKGFDPIVITESSPELRILGKVVGVYRETA